MYKSDVSREMASLALALSSDIEFIAIVKASPEAISDSKQSYRLLLLDDIVGKTDEEKARDAFKQAEKKSHPWEWVHVLYRLEPVKRLK